MNANKLNLSDREKKFLLKFEKDVENMFIRYFMGGLFLCLAIVGLIMFFIYKNKDGFLMAIFFGGYGSAFLLLSRVYKKLYTIINKMKQYIKELEELKKK